MPRTLRNDTTPSGDWRQSVVMMRFDKAIPVSDMLPNMKLVGAMPTVKTTVDLEYVRCAASQIFFFKTEVYGPDGRLAIIVVGSPNLETWSEFEPKSPNAMLKKLVCTAGNEARWHWGSSPPPCSCRWARGPPAWTGLERVPWLLDFRRRAATLGRPGWSEPECAWRRDLPCCFPCGRTGRPREGLRVWIPYQHGRRRSDELARRQRD